MHKTLILALIIILISSGSGWALPADSSPEQDIHGGDFAAQGSEPAVPSAKVPDGPIEMFIRDGADSRFEVYFIDVKYGYDLVDFESYNAWCLEEGKPIRRNALHKIKLYNAYDPELPAKFRNMDWNRINYVINHKQGAKTDVQMAVWHYAGTLKKPLSPVASKIVEDADANGKDFKPAGGDLVGVVCDTGEKKQPVFVEYLTPKSEPIVVSSAAVAPIPLVTGGLAVPAWLSLLPLGAVAPFVGGGGDSPHHPTPHTPVPEPGALLMLACGVAGVIAFRKFKKRR